MNPFADKQYEIFAADAVDITVQAPGDDDIERSVIRVLIRNQPAQHGLDVDSIKRLRHFLIEFSTYYTSKKQKRSCAFINVVVDTRYIASNE